MMTWMYPLIYTIQSFAAPGRFASFSCDKNRDYNFTWNMLSTREAWKIMQSGIDRGSDEFTPALYASDASPGVLATSASTLRDYP